MDLVYTFTVASIGVRFIATTAATGFALLRENNGISSVSSARRDAINAGYTKAIDDLAADLAGHNANEALDDPIAVAAAQKSAKEGVRAAWQNVNNLQGRAAETFAGMGPGGWGMTIAGMTGWFDGSWFDWSAFGSSIGSSIGSIGDSFAGMYYTIIGDDFSAQQSFHDAYVNGPLGQTTDSSGFYYWGTRGSLGVAVIAVSAAGGVGAYEFVTGSQFLVESSGIWNIIRGRIGSGGLVQIRPVGGRPLVRLDYHAFEEGGRRLLHMDFTKIKHFPWKQVARWFN